MLPSLHRVVVFFAIGVDSRGLREKTQRWQNRACAPPPAPSAGPDDLQAGQSTTLTWNTENASQLSITGVGGVAAKGSTTIRLQSWTTYVLTATGPGGSKEASARVTVTQPPPLTAKAAEADEELFFQNVKDVFFAYDESDVAANEESAVQQDARFLIAHPYLKLLISGHCDERVSEDYNLTLGDSRAGTIARQLKRLGVQADRIRCNFDRNRQITVDQERVQLPPRRTPLGSSIYLFFQLRSVDRLSVTFPLFAARAFHDHFIFPSPTFYPPAK